MNHLVKEIIKTLRLSENGPAVESMQRAGINYRENYGVSVVDLRRIATSYKGNHQLALDLWEHGSREGKILATLIADHEKITPEQAQQWVETIEQAEITDHLCMNLLSKTSFAPEKIAEWCQSSQPLVKTTGFVLLSRVALTRNDVDDKQLEPFFELIEANTAPAQTYLRNAVSRALRRIGRRNAGFNQRAIAIARQLQQSTQPTSRWIAEDALYELEVTAGRF